MKKYIITIVNLRTGVVDKFQMRTDEGFKRCVDTHLGGWHNLNSYYDKEGDLIGILKDRPAKFSILCY